MLIEIWAECDGLGHITRQINLARELQTRPALQDGQIRFVVDAQPALQHLVRASGFPLVVRPGPLAEARAFMAARWQAQPPDIFILDSVRQDQDPHVAPLLRQPGVYSLAVIDDPRQRRVAADLVVNALPSLSGVPSPRPLDTVYCLGKDYFILAPEFSAGHAQARSIRPVAQQGFIFFGGLDGNDFTSLALDAIARLEGMAWTLLVGALYAGAAAVEARVRRAGLPVRVVRQVPDMAQLLSEVDVALLAGGNSLIEAAALGTPTVAGCQNDIQYENARFFADRCGLPCLGRPGEFDAQAIRQAVQGLVRAADWRQALSQSLKREIDGQGARRVADALLRGWHEKSGDNV